MQPDTTDRRLIDTSVRPVLLVVLVACVSGFVALSIRYYRSRGLDPFDYRVLNAIPTFVRHRQDWAVAFADLGGPAATVLITAAIAITMLVRRHVRAGVLAAASPAVAVTMTEVVLKPVVDRAPWGVYTFPSGHTASAFSVVTVVVVILLAGGRTTAWRFAASAFAVVLGCLVALGLTVARYHFFTDTVGGAAVGVAVPLALALAVDAVAYRVTRHQRSAKCSTTGGAAK